MKSIVVEGNRQRKVMDLNWRALTLAFVLCALLLSLCGCGRGYHGETAAEANRRHKRILRTNMEAMRSDIDTALMLDRPSQLTDRRLP
jgi:hypothetical protein